MASRRLIAQQRECQALSHIDDQRDSFFDLCESCYVELVDDMSVAELVSLLPPIPEQTFHKHILEALEHVEHMRLLCPNCRPEIKETSLGLPQRQHPNAKCCEGEWVCAVCNCINPKQIHKSECIGCLEQSEVPLDVLLSVNAECHKHGDLVRRARSRSLSLGQPSYSSGGRRLEDRLSSLQLITTHIRADGNCQFRTVSFELWRTQKYHRILRTLAVHQLDQQRDLYQFLFEDENSFNSFCQKMAQDCEWGDEISLKALCDALKVHIHVITDTNENWYLLYTPNDADLIRPADRRTVFSAYLNPIHYNAILHVNDIASNPSLIDSSSSSPRPIPPSNIRSTSPRMFPSPIRHTEYDIPSLAVPSVSLIGSSLAPSPSPRQPSASSLTTGSHTSRPTAELLNASRLPTSLDDTYNVIPTTRNSARVTASERSIYKQADIALMRLEQNAKYRNELREQLDRQKQLQRDQEQLDQRERDRKLREQDRERELNSAKYRDYGVRTSYPVHSSYWSTSSSAYDDYSRSLAPRSYSTSLPLGTPSSKASFASQLNYETSRSQGLQYSSTTTSPRPPWNSSSRYSGSVTYRQPTSLTTPHRYA